MYSKNILDYFEDTVERYPEKNALVYRDQSLSFGALYGHVQYLASYIIEVTGGYSKRPICIFLPKGIYVVIGDIATLYSGNFF